jgi:hypothetical protein
VLVASCSVGDGVEDIVCSFELAAQAVAQRIVEDEGLLTALSAVAIEGEAVALGNEVEGVSGGDFVTEARVEDGDS